MECWEWWEETAEVWRKLHNRRKQKSAIYPNPLQNQQDRAVFWSPLHHSIAPSLHRSIRILNIKSPPSLAAEQGLNGGWEFAMLSFPGRHWAPPLRGCQLPDAILHGKRSYRPRSRAVRRLAASGLLSEAFQLAWAGVCGTGLRTRQRHACETFSASLPLSARSATVFYGTFA